MTVTDFLLILSTLLSPLIALQVSTWLARRSEERGRKEWVFKVLMATRANVVAPVHVEALNRISLEFSPKRAAEKVVLDAWEQYHDHLGTTQDQNWGTRRVDLMVDLLHAMSKTVGYSFSKTQIKNGIYSPIAHGELEQDQIAMRKMVLEVLRGERAIPLKAGPETAAPNAAAGN